MVAKNGSSPGWGEIADEAEEQGHPRLKLAHERGLVDRPQHELRGATEERDVVDLLDNHPGALGGPERAGFQVVLAERRP
jgi:hypothetical protein